MDNSSDLKAVNYGKREIAKFIKNFHSSQYLDLIIDTHLDYKVPINDNESIEWIKWLIAGGESPDNFSTIVKKYNTATTCGLVWTSDTVAYRCKTCGISPCTSLCADCFMNGQHIGHDFKMFRSQTGGACDCGDMSVVKSSGFCNKHGIVHHLISVHPPPDLLYIAELMAPRIFLRLILHLRHYKQGCDNSASCDAKDFMKMLTNLSGMGSAMRRVLTSALIDTKIYKELTENWTSTDESLCTFMAKSKRLYEEALKSLENPDPPSEFADCPGLQRVIKHRTFLEELIFWTVKYEFPQEIVCFLLDLLPDFRYKEAMMEAFVLHYSRIAMVLEKAVDLDSLSSRVVNVSVQLFSHAELALRMTKKLKLLEVMIASLKNVMNQTLIPVPLSSQNHQFISCKRNEVVDCSQPVVNKRCYWPLVSDLNNVLSHRPVAVEFMENETLLNIWFSFLSRFQEMNVNQRELTIHADIKPEIYFASFIAELEISSFPMWALLSHLKKDDCFIPLTKRVLHSCLGVLKDWLEAVIILPSSEDNQMSFHIPLHRYLATFICQAVNVQQLPLKDVLPPKELIEPIIRHPLRIQVAFYEIMNGLWVRNDLQIQGQAMTYLNSNFCTSMVDADLYLLQILCTQLPAVQFIQNVIDKFQINDYLSFSNKLDKPETSTDCENAGPMLESFLQFLATLCTNRTNLCDKHYGDEASFSVLKRLEMTTLLSIKDQTHSKLLEMMPERTGSGLTRDFDLILNQVADYIPPSIDVSGNLQPGLYVPKACVWKDLYDPIHVLLRAEKTKIDFQESLDRFTTFVRQSSLLPPGTTPWPPFRIPHACNSSYTDPQVMLNSRLFHSIIWIVLYKYVHEKNVTENALSLAVYLLELALHSYATEKQNNVNTLGGIHKREIINNELDAWFESDDLSVNLLTTIKTIRMPSQKYQTYFKNDDSSTNVPNKVRRYLHCYPPVLPVLRKAAGQQRKCVPIPLIDVDGSGDMELLGPDPLPDVKIFNANESIISLLLKIHSKLSGYQDSFQPDSVRFEDSNVRIGDGVFFVAKVLIRIMMLNEKCKNEVRDRRAKLWPKVESKMEGQTNIDEKKRKALERQQKFMELFAIQRDKFAEKNLPVSNEENMEWEGSETAEKSIENVHKQFDCGICRQASSSTEENPVVLVVLVQASGVLGHRRKGPHSLVLPTSNADTIDWSNSMSSHCQKKVEEYSREFSQQSWQQSIDFTPKGSVYVQTCGHHLHLKCLLGYVKTCSKRGEYTCPVCRQLANSILPVSPKTENSRNIAVESIEEGTAVSKITNLIENTDWNDGGRDKSISVRAVEQLIQDTKSRICNTLLTNCDTDHIYATFIARSNLEIEIVQRGGTLKSEKSSSFGAVPKFSCILPLLRVLGSCTSDVDRTPIRITWQQINGIVVAKKKDSEGNATVPLLLRDPISLLIQLILVLPIVIDQPYFTCIVKSLCNLLYLQIIAEISLHLDETERNYFRRKEVQQMDSFSLCRAMKFVVEAIDKMALYEEDGAYRYIEQDPAYEIIELKIQEMCLPFLRIATLLKHHLYNEKLPEVPTATDEFWNLVNYLQLVAHNRDHGKITPSSVFAWEEDKLRLIKYWMEELENFARNKPIVARKLLSELYVAWKQPKLIRLPNEYDRIFQYYLKKPCETCNLIPCEGAICLACGILVCFKRILRKLDEIPEAIQHANTCGGGTAMFLVVMSSSIVVVCDQRACVWGSVYLDMYGEEDRDLKRGKPLYLNLERYQVLERQWLNHSFDHLFNHREADRLFLE